MGALILQLYVTPAHSAAEDIYESVSATEDVPRDNRHYCGTNAQSTRAFMQSSEVAEYLKFQAEIRKFDKLDVPQKVTSILSALGTRCHPRMYGSMRHIDSTGDADFEARLERVCSHLKAEFHKEFPKTDAHFFISAE